MLRFSDSTYLRRGKKIKWQVEKKRSLFNIERHHNVLILVSKIRKRFYLPREEKEVIFYSACLEEKNTAEATTKLKSSSVIFIKTLKVENSPYKIYSRL
jgi:hypothetical protein